MFAYTNRFSCKTTGLWLVGVYGENGQGGLERYQHIKKEGHVRLRAWTQQLVATNALGDTPNVDRVPKAGQ